MAPSQAEAALAKLTALQGSHPISIIQLGEPISSARHTPPSANATDDPTMTGAVGSAEPSGRTSDASAIAATGPTPSSLEADLAHYRELFAKLRFSYVEQVTKEKFIRAI